MKLIMPSAVLLPSLDYINMSRFIERCGRICYKSEDKITDDSAEKFVKQLIKSGHESVLEHSNIIINVNEYIYEMMNRLNNDKSKFYTNSWFINDRSVLSGNVRVFRDLVKNKLLPNDLHAFLYNKFDLLFNDIKTTRTTKENFTLLVEGELSDYDLMKHTRRSVHFICDRGVSHELVRSRKASISQESTRYCNYGSDKFGGELTFIKPLFVDLSMIGNCEFSADVYDSTDDTKSRLWSLLCLNSEYIYLDLLKHGATPQEARSVLPNSLKTELIMTMNLSDWHHFFTLRVKSNCHPQMTELTRPLLKMFQAEYPEKFNNIKY